LALARDIAIATEGKVKNEEERNDDYDQFVALGLKMLPDVRSGRRERA
jgi:hypothetical protein